MQGGSSSNSRHRRASTPRKERCGDLAGGGGGGQTHRRAVRHRARQWLHDDEPGCRARPRSPGRSTKCSGVWAASPVSCGGSASPASRRTCASQLLRWGASFGSSLAPSAVPRVPRHGHADRHRQAQRYRSAGLAGRGRPHREHTSDPVVRIAVVELAYPRRHGGAASRLSRGKLGHLTYLTVS